jgi:hypothetical protein
VRGSAGTANPTRRHSSGASAVAKRDRPQALQSGQAIAISRLREAVKWRNDARSAV